MPRAVKLYSQTMKIIWNAWLVSVVAAFIQPLYMHGDLPSRIATHFDFSGKPNGWSDKNSFVLLWIGMIVLVNVWVLATRPLTLKAGSRWLSIPNKDYWTSSNELFKKAVSLVTDLVAGIMLGVNIVIILSYMTIHEFNTEGSITMNIMPVVVANLVYTSLFIVYMLLKFRVPKEKKNPGIS